MYVYRRLYLPSISFIIHDNNVNRQFPLFLRPRAHLFFPSVLYLNKIWVKQMELHSEEVSYKNRLFSGEALSHTASKSLIKTILKFLMKKIKCISKLSKNVEEQTIGPFPL